MRQWTVDAFASEPFKGNPACVLEPFNAWPDAGWMQALAAENNQAETAFLRRTADPAAFELRWFTPTMEVPLCGHATLASAHVLMTELDLAEPSLSFETLSGVLSVMRSEGGYEMDFPLDPTHPVPTPAGLAAALGAEPDEVWAGKYLIALFGDAGTVRSLRPDIGALASLGTGVERRPGNVAVAALSDDPAFDVVDRFFAPGSGIPEDPTTGSVHCGLAGLFSQRLGRDALSFFQAYPGRGGALHTRVVGDRVRITGRAVTVAESRLRLTPAL